MSTTDPRLQPTHWRKSAVALLPLADANAVLQKAMQTMATDVRNDLVLRCDELPLVAGTEQQLGGIVAQLLQMIMTKKDTCSRLYLHISCTRTDATEKNGLPKGYGTYTVQFHTNIVPCADWMRANEVHLENIRAVLLTLGGTLQVNHLKNTGCLFALTLPGKL